MKRKSCLKPLLLTLYCLSNLQWTLAAPATTTPSVPTPEVVTEALKTQPWEFPSPCYVEKSKVDPLLSQIKDIFRMSSSSDEHLPPDDNSQVDQESSFLDRCTNERIAEIQNNTAEFAGKLSQLMAEQLKSAPSVESFLSWDLKKRDKLIQGLRALHVFYDNSSVLYPFRPLVDHVEYIWEKALAQKIYTPPLTTTQVPLPTFDSAEDFKLPPYCSEIPTSEKDRISRLMKQQTTFLLNALESEMRLYAKSVPHLKLVLKTSNDTQESFNADRPACHINTNIFNHWNHILRGSIKWIHLPSEAASEDYDTYLSLEDIASNVKSLLQVFSKDLTEPHKTQWQLILNTAIDLKIAVDDLGPMGSGPQPCILPQVPRVEYERVLGYVASADYEDATWYSSAELTEE